MHYSRVSYTIRLILYHIHGLNYIHIQRVALGRVRGVLASVDVEQVPRDQRVA